MSANKLGEIIRTEKDLFKTPNLYRCLDNGMVDVYNENFRNNKQDTELVLFYHFENKYYFPIWFEFRSINNNILFLIKEFEVDTFGLLRRILISSLEKEEHYTALIQAVVYHPLKMPPHSVLIEGFEILEGDRIDVFE